MSATPYLDRWMEKRANRVWDWARRTSPLHSLWARLGRAGDDFLQAKHLAGDIPDSALDAYAAATRPMHRAMRTDTAISKRLGLYNPRNPSKATETELSPEEVAAMFGDLS